VVGGHRGVPDISMSAACNGAVDTYSSYPGAPVGWTPSCGTSEATPLFAGIVALADQAAGHSLGLINPVLYKLSAAHAPGIVDVTKGNNTVSFTQGGHQHTVAGFAARPGYDLASGVGTVNAAFFVPELAATATKSGLPQSSGTLKSPALHAKSALPARH
jgi:subtilase family serine protease